MTIETKDGIKVEETITTKLLDNKGNVIVIVNGLMDLRDHDIIDIIDMIQKNIRNDSHRGVDKVLLPVGWILISTEEYNKRIMPSWWIGTKYETPILIIKIAVVVVVILLIPYVALSRIENIPDEYRIAAKDKQSSTGSG